METQEEIYRALLDGKVVQKVSTWVKVVLFEGNTVTYDTHKPIHVAFTRPNDWEIYEFIPKYGEIIQVNSCGGWLRREFIARTSDGWYLCWDRNKTMATRWSKVRSLSCNNS